MKQLHRKRKIYILEEVSINSSVGPKNIRTDQKSCHQQGVNITLPCYFFYSETHISSLLLFSGGTLVNKLAFFREIHTCFLCTFDFLAGKFGSEGAI